jgi:hypothetical protein
VRQAPVANVDDADRFSRFFTMSSYSIRQNGELWRTGSVKLWVVFDKEQRVTRKMLEQDDPWADALRKATETKSPQ